MTFVQVIRTNVALLKFSGAYPLEDETPWKMVLSYCAAFVSAASLMTHTYAYVHDFVIHAAYIEAAIESFALIISLFGGFLRYLILYISRGKIQEILKTLESVWDLLDNQERRNVTLSIKSSKNLTYFFLSQCIFTIFFYTIAPLFTGSTGSNVNATRGLPYAFFMDVHRSPYYEILYFLQVSSMLNVGITCVGVDMIGPILITTVCGHLRVIQEQLRNIEDRMIVQDQHVDLNGTKELHEMKTSRNLCPQSVPSKLRSCINYHKTILSICRDVENLTNIMFLTQLIGSTYTLSAVGFKLSGDDPDKYKYSTQIIIGMVQLLICNWPADVLLTESVAVAEAAYFAPWYQWPDGLKKSVFIVIIRAQKPIRLTAGKFMYLSLETFASMVSTAVSFFTVLSSFN